MAQPQSRFSTSVDMVAQQRYNTTSLLGLKRPFEQIDAANHSLPDNHALTDTTNSAPRCANNKDRHFGLVAKIRLEASEVSDVSQGGTTVQPLSEYVQQKTTASPPGSTLNPLLSLCHSRYGLPEALVKNLASLGISSIYPWQSSCLLGRGILTGEKNLVYTAPTGGGKSLVADVLMLKRIIEDSTKKAILVLPYVALIQEKVKWLRKVVEGVDVNLHDVIGASNLDLSRVPKTHQRGSVRIVGFFGGSKARATWADVDVAICTIEKANSLVNAAIEQCTINDLGVVVFDELHMIDDDHRGYLMELMATKLLSLQHGVQIIGMSATLSNTELLARWLDAKYYKSKYRPVPIEEYLVYDNSIYPASTSSAFLQTASQLNATQPRKSVSPIRIIRPSVYKDLRNPVSNAMVSLAIETVRSGYGVLIFCSGRQGCKSTAALISEAMPSKMEIDNDLLNRRNDVVSDLRSLSVGLDDILAVTVLRGVAFHHAGLTIEERDIVADAYDKGIIRVIVATCSLAAGVNLPARRVILQGARMGRELIGPAMLRQMRGRAGRKGKDDIGESFLCCEKSDLEEVVQLLKADLPILESSLTPEKRGIKRALLEIITIRLATHVNAIHDYVQRTLLFHTLDRDDLNKMVEATMADLDASGLITVNSTDTYEATLLSQAIVISSLTPEDGIFVHGELQRARRAFVMDGEMHVMYMFTPIQLSGLGEINWPIFRKEMEGLDESGYRVLEFVGVNPGFVIKMANSSKPILERNPEEIRIARIYRRFYAAFQLRDLCNEVPIHAVARKYKISRGFVQTLAQTCEGFAAGMIQFCERMGWGMLKSVLEHMSDRLKVGAKADLLELAKIPFVKSRTARVFWENGMKSVRVVAEANATDLVPILLLAQPRKFRIDEDAETKYHQKLMLKAEIIIGAANRLWERQQQIDIETDL